LFQAAIAREVPNPATATPVTTGLVSAGKPHSSLINSSEAFDAFTLQNSSDVCTRDRRHRWRMETTRFDPCFRGDFKVRTRT
jgi:hypothetical protein